MAGDLKEFVVKASLWELLCAAIPGGVAGALAADAWNGLSMGRLATLRAQLAAMPDGIVFETAMKFLLIEFCIVLTVYGASKIRKRGLAGGGSGARNK